MAQKFANDARSKLTGPITATSLSLLIDPTDQARFPVAAASDWFKVKLEDAAGNIEYVRVQRASGSSTLTCVSTAMRGYEDPTIFPAASWSAGATVELVATADDLEASLAHPSTGTDAHDASAISVVPAGGIASTDVQAALQELDSEKLALAGGTLAGTLTIGAAGAGQLELVDGSAGSGGSEAGHINFLRKVTNAVKGFIGWGDASSIQIHANAGYNFLFTGRAPRSAIAPTFSQDLLRLGDLATGPGGGQYSHRNLLVNGNFAVNQRGYVSGTNVGAANTYTLDMWRVVTSGQAVTFTNLGGGTANFANQVTAPAGGLEQVVPGENIQGGTYVLSWVGAGTAKVNNVAVSNSVPFTLPAGLNAIVQFVGVVAYAQLEPGGTATTFEYLPYEVNLQRCERFYEVGEAVVNGYAAGGSSNSHRVHFRTRKYKVPTLSYTIGGVANASVYDARNPSADGLEWFVQASITGGVVFTGSWTASAEP